MLLSLTQTKFNLVGVLWIALGDVPLKRQVEHCVPPPKRDHIGQKPKPFYSVFNSVRICVASMLRNSFILSSEIKFSAIYDSAS